MQPFIDRAELDEQTFHDPAIRGEIIAMFLDQAPTILAAIDGGTGAARADSAHRLKGSALALGARPLAEAASGLEMEPDSAAALANLRLTLEKTLETLRQLVP